MTCDARKISTMTLLALPLMRPIFAVFLMAGCFVSGVALGDELHGSDIELEIENGKLVTHNGRIFESSLDTLVEGFYKSEAPGFDSAAGLLQEGEEIGFDLLQALLYWDGSELTAPSAGPGLTLKFGSLSKLVTTTTTDFTGFSLGGGGIDQEENYVGDFHKHFDFLLPESGPLGAYGVLLKLTPFGDSTFLASDPFLIVFNRGLDAESFEAGVDAMVEVTAVPEPSSLVLTGLGALGLVAAALRRRRQAP